MSARKKSNSVSLEDAIDNAIQNRLIDITQSSLSLKHGGVLSMSTMGSMSNNTTHGYTTTSSGNGYVDIESIKDNFPDYETLMEFLNEGKIDKEKELIDLVSRLVMERIDELLDKDTDEIVRILIENKLFQDENTGLKKHITELEEKINDLTVRLNALENKENNGRYDGGDRLNWYTASPNTGGWTTITATATTVPNSSVPELSMSAKKPSFVERLAEIKKSLFERKNVNDKQIPSNPDEWGGIICTRT